MSDERVKSGLLGVLPDGWSAERLGNIGLFLRGGGGSKQDEVDDGLPCVRYGDLYTHHDCRITDTRSRISPDRVNSYTPLRYGDVLFASSGETVDDIGRSAVNLIRGRAYCGGDVIILRPAIEINSSFLGHVADCASSRIQKSRLGRGSTVIHIYDEELRDLVIPVPPVEEQRRIAEILDTVDETIQATERVIAKHKQIRSGIATDLLTGKCGSTLRESQESRDVPQDCAPRWEKRQLGDIGTVVGGGTPSRDNPHCWGDFVPWLTPGELTGNKTQFVSVTEEKISARGLANSGARVVPEGTLLMTSRASIGFCALAGVPMTTNQGFKNLIPGVDIDPSFLWLVGRTLQREMIRRASGTTFLEISTKEFQRIEIDLPPLEEQRRIAEVLDSIDETIRRNEEQLDKLQQIRSGLAEDLLSGRVRTVAA